MQARRGRIEADVGGDALRREQRRQALGGVVHQAAPRAIRRSRFVIRDRDNRLLYQSMAITRRARAQGARSPTGVGARRRRRRVRLSLRAARSSRSRAPTLPVAGLPPALAGLRIGCITDVHRSRWVSHEDVARAVDHADGASSPI